MTVIHVFMRVTNHFITKLTLLCCLLLILFFKIHDIYHFSYMWQNQLHNFGAIDFIAFWSGTRIFLDGGNPYSIQDMHVWHQLLLPDARQVNPFISPPWAIPLFIPITLLPFNLASWVWICINIFFAAAIPLLIYKHLCTENKFSRPPHWQWLFLSCLLLPPNLMNMYLGQLGMAMAFFAVLMFYLLKKERYVLAGLTLIPLSLKPQIMLLIIIPLLIFLIKKRRWEIAGVAAIGMLFLISFVFFHSHDIFNKWIATWNIPFSLKTATLTTAIRYILFIFTGELYRWPMIIIPVCGSLGVLIWIFLNGLDLKWQGTIPVIMTISVLFAPYAWFHDFCLVLPIQIVILLITMDSRFELKNKIELYFWIIIINILILLPKNMGISIFWYPTAVLSVWWRFKQLLRLTPTSAKSTP